MIRWSSLRSSRVQLLRAATAGLLVAVLAICTSANSFAQAAQEQSSPAQSSLQSGHVVSPADLQKEAAQASSTREQNRQMLDDFLSSPQAEKALQSAHMDPAQVKSAVSSLNDAELDRLSARASVAQADFAAGRISDRDLLWILIAVAALIVIIVAVR
jgi:hypothetical protein